MDKGYDNNRVYARCRERGCAAVMPLWKGQTERDVDIPRSSSLWRSLCCRRSAVEREFRRLKHDYGLALLRVRGVERARLHADLVMLARSRSRRRLHRHGARRTRAGERSVRMAQ